MNNEDVIDFDPVGTPQPKIGLTPMTEVARPFKERGFNEDTIKRYRVNVAKDGDPFVAKYPLFDVNGNHVSNKVRTKATGHNFLIEGSFKDAGLFGRHAFPEGGKYVTVVEGQDDALATFQMFGGKYPVVSVHSASTAEKDIKRDFEYLNSFETIVFAFDSDEAGRKAAKAAAGAGFALGKVKVLTLRKFKDANEYLLAKESETYVREWWQAPSFRPDGLVFGKELLDTIVNAPNPFTIPYPWESINKMTYGIRLSEFVLVMADTGAGKTTVFKEIAYNILKNETVREKNYSVGFLHLEETIRDTALGLMSIHSDKPYHLPDTEKTKEEMEKVHEEVFGDNRTILYDSFGSNDIDVILNKIRHMAALGARYIFLDHLSIIVSDGEGDERKLLDAISTKLKTLTVELDIAVFAVIHTNRQGLARGSAGPEKVANIHISLERSKKDADEWRRNVLKLTVEKNRFCGKTGPCTWMEYRAETGRLSELDEEGIDRYESGGTLREDERWG